MRTASRFEHAEVEICGLEIGFTVLEFFRGGTTSN